MIEIIRATVRERRVIKQLRADTQKYFASLIPKSLTVQVLVAHEVFGPSEADWVGACVHKGDNLYQLLLRPSSDGGLYRTALHEYGHALGLDHTSRSEVMAAAKRQRQLALTPLRRRRWLADFGTLLLKKRLAEQIS